MELIQSRLTPVNLDSDWYNQIIKRIDCKIASMAGVQLFNKIYGFKSIVDLNLYDDLCDYREILLDKLMGCNCLMDEDVLYIVERIKKLLIS